MDGMASTLQPGWSFQHLSPIGGPEEAWITTARGRRVELSPAGLARVTAALATGDRDGIREVVADLIDEDIDAEAWASLCT